jgi:histidinol-phosphate aminotransferase
MSLPFRANVLAMSPYVPGKPIEEVKRELGLTDVVKLASNENPFGPSPKAVEAVRESAARMHQYPDGASYELRTKISQKFGVPYGQVMVGNGSDELIHLLGLIFLDSPEDECVVGFPGFTRYHAAAYLAPCKLIQIPVRDDYTHDLTEMARRIHDHTKLVYIDNPNNPTGTLLRKAEVDAFLRDVPENVPVVLDEAYYEFAAHLNDFPNSLDYLREGRPNVIGLRTFSKAYGLAGVRLGYGWAPEAVVDAFHRAREPFDVNVLAQAAGIAALDDEEHVRKTVENNRRGVERLAGVFREAGAKPQESFANFLFVDLGRPARPVYQALLERGVVTRPGDLLGDPNCLRVSIGTEAEMEKFVRAYQDVMKPAVPA